MRPTISVITPTHEARARNGKLLRAQKSVLAQTLLPDAHIVVVDRDKRGAAPTRQQALMLAQTDWVAFLDSDDVFLPRHLELCMAHAEKTGADFVYSWFKIIQEWWDGRYNIIEGDSKGDGVFPLTHFTNDWDPENPIETTITTLVRTELAKEVGFQALDRGEANSGEDRYFTIGCMNAGAKISHLKRKTWLWSHHWLANERMGNTSGIAGHGDDDKESLLTY